jgi:hypothetical protein
MANCCINLQNEYAIQKIELVQGWGGLRFCGGEPVDPAPALYTMPLSVVFLVLVCKGLLIRQISSIRCIFMSK